MVYLPTVPTVFFFGFQRRVFSTDELRFNRVGNRLFRFSGRIWRLPKSLKMEIVVSWFPKYVFGIFTPKIGELIQFDEHICGGDIIF